MEKNHCQGDRSADPGQHFTGQYIQNTGAADACVQQDAFLGAFFHFADNGRSPLAFSDEGTGLETQAVLERIDAEEDDDENVSEIDDSDQTSYLSDPARYHEGGLATLAQLAGGLTLPVDSEFALADAAQAHRRLQSGQSAGAILLRPDSQP